jgi:hypothetical protein
MQTLNMTPLQKHNLVNRARRIPRRIIQLNAEANSIDARVATVEELEPKKDGVTQDWKDQTIRSLRQQYGSLVARINRLVDRKAGLGVRV